MFTVEFSPSSTSVLASCSAPPKLAELGISVTMADSQRIVTRAKRIVLLDGGAIGMSPTELAEALEAEDDELLSGLHGHYSALVIDHDGQMRGHCDRFGGRSLFWQALSRRIVIASRWEAMPIAGTEWDETGLPEMFRYRWTSGQRTLLAGVSRLPQWRRVRFARDGEIAVLATRQKPALPATAAPKPFREQLDATRGALKSVFDDVAASHRRAAVFLSGGVDSSLLAAMARAAFDECLLVTPAFAGGHNPELGKATAFARTLGLEHLVVAIDESRLTADLRELAGAKGGQIKFHLLAMLQMAEAIPDEYSIVIYGEGADTLFGAAPFRRAERLLQRRRRLRLLPRALLRLLSASGSPRLEVARSLAESSAVDVLLRHFLIPYDPVERALVERLCGSRPLGIYAEDAAARFLATRDRPLRSTLQDIALTIDCANHFREIDLVMSRVGKQVVSPFMAKEVVAVAAALTDEQYFGRGYVKPILRELACEHYDRALIYREKHGFEIPYAAWLNGALSEHVDAVRRERMLFDGRLLRSVRTSDRHQLYWTLINWLVVNETLLERKREQQRPPAAAKPSGDRDDLACLPRT